MAKVVDPAAAVTLLEEGVTVRTGVELAACTTVTVAGLPVAPGTVMVIAAVLELQLLLAVKLAEMVPFPTPADGVKVNQFWLLVAVHSHSLLIVKAVEPSEDDTFKLVGVTDNEQNAPGCVTMTVAGTSPGTVIVMIAVL
jgi:hypothetical protein